MKISTTNVIEKAIKHLLIAHPNELSNVQRQSLRALLDGKGDLRDHQRLNEAATVCRCEMEKQS